MKILIAYYSRTGNTKKIANLLKNKLNCDIEAIEDLNKHSGVIGWLKGGYESSQNKKAEIGSVRKNPEDYDLVIIGSPVWASKLASPVTTYVKQYKDNFKEVACFATCNARGQDGTFKQLEEITNKQLKAKMSFNKKTIEDPDIEIGKFIEKVKK